MANDREPAHDAQKDAELVEDLDLVSDAELDEASGGLRMMLRHGARVPGERMDVRKDLEARFGRFRRRF